ncbi:MAG: diguanylate cyclase [Acidobacteria bacterium]|nr:diguanylate cyclase [Acidobacteriota bacterium]
MMGLLQGCSSPFFILPILTTFLLSVFLIHKQKQAKAAKEFHEEQLRRFSALQVLSAGISGASDLKQLGDQALSGVLHALNIHDGYAILLVPRTLDSDFFVAHRLPDPAMAEILRGPLRSYLASSAERWGSLVVFPDLLRPNLNADWPRDPIFPQFREFFSAQGARTLLVAGLHSQEKSRGALLVGSQESREFSPEEIRLTVALANQVAVAIENRSLRKTAERHEDDLRVLHRVVDSLRTTFDLQAQIQTLQRELQGFLGSAQLALSYQDSAEGPLITVTGTVPQESKNGRNAQGIEGLVQYVLDSGTPLVISEDFLGTVRKLGIASVDPRIMSWAGVPIQFSDKTSGVLTITDNSQEDRVSGRRFGLLKVLAGEVAVAIENARLFQQEQKRAGHLALLNELTRKATAVLDPQELLDHICGELHKSFNFELVRVETLDREKEELVVAAEVGYGPSIVGRRTKFGQGFAGITAETQEPHLADDVLTSDRYLPFHPGVRSALHLPMKYRQELMAVLSIESLRPKSFSSQDVLTLSTLADQLAIALKNAQAYQVAQEQAITDGLTSLKTHRFFMQAVDGEWRRSPRSGKPFSLIMMDLDGFKQLNERQGHLEGDKVLTAVARVLEASSRQSNTVARYGGDQFALLVPEAAAEQAQSLAERLRANLGADSYLSGRGVTASFGIGTFPVHGVTPEEIVRVAESGMYLAKHEKGNRVRVASHSQETSTTGWDQQLLQAYLGVAVKRMFATGPEVFNQYLARFEAATGVNGDSASLMDTVTALAFTIDAKDHYTQGHSQSVSRLAAQIGQEVGLTKDELEEIRLAGILHDIGKIGVPEIILNKPSGLTPEEYELMKSHTTLGERILAPLKFKAIEAIKKIVRHHHERMDGKGYPDGLTGEDIPLGARIITIADCYDTIISDRSYKKASPLEEALEELRRGRGTQFDAKLLDAFLNSLAAALPPRRGATARLEVN